MKLLLKAMPGYADHVRPGGMKPVASASGPALPSSGGTFQLSRRANSPKTGKVGAGTFYTTHHPGEGWERSEHKFQNVLRVPEHEYGTYAGNPSHALFARWFPHLNNNDAVHKLHRRIGGAMGHANPVHTIDHMVAHEAHKRGYDGIMYGSHANGEVQDLRDFKPTHPDYKKAMKLVLKAGLAGSEHHGHVKQHTRRTRSGGLTTVHDFDRTTHGTEHTGQKPVRQGKITEKPTPVLPAPEAAPEAAPKAGKVSYAGQPHPMGLPHAPTTEAERAPITAVGHRPVPPESWGLTVNPHPEYGKSEGWSDGTVAKYLDRAGKPQYIYTKEKRAGNQANNFKRVAEEVMPQIPNLRARYRGDMAGTGATFERVAAAVTMLMDEHTVRVGSEANTKRDEGATYGASSLRKDMVSVTGDSVRVKFPGKHHKEWDRTITDPQFAAVVRDMLAKDGDRLFQYEDRKGTMRPLDEKKVNEYLQQNNLTAKDLRTYHATRLAAELLTKLGPATDEKVVRDNIRKVCVEVSELLGNTPAMCRDNYINPAVFAAYAGGHLTEDMWKALWKGQEPSDMLSVQHQRFTRLMARIGSLLAGGKILDRDPFPEDADNPSPQPTLPATPSQPSEPGPTDFTKSVLILKAAEAQKYSCAMLLLPDSLGAQLITWARDRIPSRDLHEKGVDMRPHVTVRYGFHSNQPTEVAEIVRKTPRVRVALGKCTLFEGPDYDVLKIDVSSEQLERLNKRLGALPNTQTHKEYRPHVTVAYLRKGTGRKYVGDCPLTGSFICFDTVTYSNPNRDQTDIALAGSDYDAERAQQRAYSNRWMDAMKVALGQKALVRKTDEDLDHPMDGVDHDQHVSEHQKEWGDLRRKLVLSADPVERQNIARRQRQLAKHRRDHLFHKYTATPAGPAIPVLGARRGSR